MRTKFITLFLFLFSFNHFLFSQTNYNLSNLLSFDGEPYIAVNPTNQSNIVAGWMRVRSDGKIWIATKASFDKGQTWGTINFMPHDSIINGSADVSIAFHNSGVAYISWINFRTSPDTAGAVFVSKSINGGLTWGAPSKVIDGIDSPDLPFDRPWIAVDNSGGVNDGTVFVTTMSAYWFVGQHHIYLRTSSDGGLTWSTIKQVDNTAYSVGSLTSSYGGISIGSDGKAYIAFISYDVSSSPFVRYYSVTTSDAGSTFQRNIIGNVFISGGSDFTKAWCIKANPVYNGNAILTWIDNRNGDYDILLSKTNDGGISWSAPIRVNDDPINNGIVQDMVWADFSTSGKLALAWKDRRLSGTGSSVPFDIYAAVSNDTADTFSTNYRITTVSNPYFLVPQGNSFIGCSISDSAVYVNWGDYRNSPDWDIYFNKTDLSDLFTSVAEHSKDNSSTISVFPNPALNSISFSLNLSSANFPFEIVIFSSIGQIVKSIQCINNQSAEYSKEIDISDFSEGLYFLYLKNNGTFLGSGTFVKIEK